jgi:hypothetical protein
LGGPARGFEQVFERWLGWVRHGYRAFRVHIV